VRLAVEQGRDATGIDSKLLDEAAREMIGAPLGLENAPIAQCLDPRQFIDHHAVTGGTAPVEVKRMAAARSKDLVADEKQVAARRQTIDSARQRLREASAKVIA
jgi:argininosuccinate lyase